MGTNQIRKSWRNDGVKVAVQPGGRMGHFSFYWSQ